MDRSNGMIRTALPAEIVSYDQATQKANVQPGVAGRFEDPESKEWLPYKMPMVTNVPVMFPAGGGFSITWPLEAGDVVYLVCAERSIDEWKSAGGPNTIPADTRRFNLSDAVAIPGLRPFSDPITAVEADTMVVEIPATMEMKLGAAATKFVALSDDVEARLQAIENWAKAHIHTAPTGPTSPPTVTPPTTTAGDTASSKVKAE